MNDNEFVLINLYGKSAPGCLQNTLVIRKSLIACLQNEIDSNMKQTFRIKFTDDDTHYYGLEEEEYYRLSSILTGYNTRPVSKDSL